MNESQIFNLLLYGWLAVAAAVFVILFFIPAPYGRHGRKGWGPAVPARLAWILMEAPAPLGLALLFALSSCPCQPTALAFLFIWQLHYVHRAFVYPFRLAPGARSLPLSVPLMGFLFNVANAYINGRWLFALAPPYPSDWLAEPRFLFGLAVFAAGMAINLHADAVLRRLRRSGQPGYQIPHGGLYRFVSSPNYFGEILEWCGWACLTWSLPGLVFALWTAANLVPRAWAHHQWYRRQFADYPARRKALVPYVF